MSKQILNFYRCAIESILTSCIIAWFDSCTVQDRMAQQRVVRSAKIIPGTALPALDSIYQTRSIKRAINIIRDISHPQHSLFTLLPSGKRYRSFKAKTSSLRDSFYPQAIRLVNGCHPLPLPQKQ